MKDVAVPPFVLFAALAFWGWQTGNLLLGGAIGALLEAAPRVRLRIDLQPQSSERLADLCTVFFVGFIVVTAATGENQRVSRAILAGFMYLPVFVAPILAAQLLSSTGRMHLSVVMRAMRRMKRRDPATRDPLVDARGAYVALAVLAAGIANTPGPAYFAGLATLAGWALWVLRPRRIERARFVLLFAFAAALGWAGQTGLTQLQAEVELWIADWTFRGMNADPYRSQTDIGSIGRLKAYDTIVMRVTLPPGGAAPFRLLHRASFNAWSGTAWYARRAPLAPLAPEADGSSWQLAPGEAPHAARIALRLESGKALLALPGAVRRLTGLPALSLQRNSLGAVRADLGGDWATYVAHAGDDIADAPPQAADAEVPAAERALFERLATKLGLAGLPAAQAIARAREHFLGYRYSTFREAPAAGKRSPLAEFIEVTRSGHCEYFAAATALLLRAAGHPTRYATGFAVLEHSALEDAWVVRARHAHAWTRVWDGAHWVDLDTTPPVWFEEEERAAPFWQGLTDLARWAGFRWSQRGEFRAGVGAWLALALLVTVLVWRLARGRRVARRGTAGAASAQRAHPGMDSPFYRVVQAMEGAPGGGRAAHEPLARWAVRAARRLDASRRATFEEALALHQRYRFDPAGLDAAARARLEALCAAFAAAPPRARIPPWGPW